MDDDAVRFYWSHCGYGTGDDQAVHVNTDYEVAIRRRRNLVSRDVEACFDKFLDFETEYMDPRFVDGLVDRRRFVI